MNRTEKEKYSTFLFLIGDQGREIFNTWRWNKILDANEQPTNEDDITTKALFEKFEEYCLPKRNVIVERRKFFWRNQSSDKSIDQYSTELKNLATGCEFENLLDGMLLYKIVDGIKSDKLRDTLLRKGGGLTLDRAIEICRIDEMTRQQMKVMSDDKEVAAINRGAGGSRKRLHDKESNESSNHNRWRNTKTTKQTGKGFKGESTYRKKCQYCGRIHKPKNCPAFGQECRRCKKKNHWANCCTTKMISENTTEENHEYVIEVIKNTDQKEQAEATTIMKMNGKSVKVKLDTGAEVNVMPKRVFDLNRDKKTLLSQTSTRLKGYGGNNIPVLGATKVQCEVNSNIEEIQFYVVETASKTVLSLKTCKKLDLIKILDEIKSSNQTAEVKQEKNEMEEKIKTIAGKYGEELKNSIVKLYPEVFNGVGKLEPAYNIKLTDKVIPVVHPPRKVPASLREKLKNELDDMEKNEIIAKVDEPTEWVNSLVIVEKPDGKLRLCLDPRNLNKAIKREHYQLPTFDEISTRISGATFSKLDANH